MGLKERLDRLVKSLVKDGKIVMLSQVGEAEWQDIEISRNLTAVTFFPEENEASREEQIQTITMLRYTVAKLVVLSMGDGTAMFLNGTWTGDEKLVSRVNKELSK